MFSKFSLLSFVSSVRDSSPHPVDLMAIQLRHGQLVHDRGPVLGRQTLGYCFRHLGGQSDSKPATGNHQSAS
ncbi:hypothetical protein DPMN_027902 [Dreissena polymorpha]|uniref:Uncharacterized protein n=1 Tax=Dreissena polymorpha TaxID=45954 RepID=A0A9D4RDW0_DREPO|nr:hypothetical protein DPMN_027902 [Dreissena polymorpha]